MRPRAIGIGAIIIGTLGIVSVFVRWFSEGRSAGVGGWIVAYAGAVIGSVFLVTFGMLFLDRSPDRSWRFFELISLRWMAEAWVPRWYRFFVASLFLLYILLAIYRLIYVAGAVP